MAQLSEQELVRREKLKALRRLGINPYPAALYPVDANSKTIKENFSEGKTVTIAGRLMSRRIQGKPVLQNCKTAKGEFRSISTETKFALTKIKPPTMKFIKTTRYRRYHRH